MNFGDAGDAKLLFSEVERRIIEKEKKGEAENFFKNAKGCKIPMRKEGWVQRV